MSSFVQYNNVPQGFAPYLKGNKLFISIPRRSPGIPSTLNYINLENGRSIEDNPKLHSYPSYEMNQLDVSEMVSSYELPSGFEFHSLSR